MAGHPTIARPYLTSGLAAKQLGISPSTLRRIVKRGGIKPAARTPAGHARFLPEDIETLRDRRNTPARLNAQSGPRHERDVRSQSIGRRASDHMAWAQQAFLRALTDHFTDLVLIVDIEGTIKYASPSHRWILGHEPEKLPGANLQAYMHPDDAPGLLVALAEPTPQGGLLWSSDVRLRHQDGTWRIFELVIRNRLADWAIGAVVLNALDITDRSMLMAELQQRAREADAMARLSGALAAELEPAVLYTLILEHVAALLPCDSATIHLIRDDWVEIAANWGEPGLPVGTRLFSVAAPHQAWLPDPRQPTMYLPDTALEPFWQDVPPWTGKYQTRSVIAVPFVIGGEMLGFLNVSSRTPQFYTPHHLELAAALGDRVTQALRSARLYLAEQERARAAAELAAMRSEFVATVSHELRTPLASILGYAEALQAYEEVADDALRREWLGRIVLSANRQKRLVEDLLLLAMMDSRRMTPRHEPVAVARVVEWAAAEVRGSYPGQQFTLEGAADLEVLADPDRTQQIVANLIDNAAKYSAEGSLITVRWSRTDTQGTVRVVDQGPGIALEGRSTLFTRFGRIAGSPIRAGRWGTGLGLYLGRKLAQAMGGTLELERTGPEGSVFMLSLPILQHHSRPVLAGAADNVRHEPDSGLPTGTALQAIAATACAGGEEGRDERVI